MNKYELRTAEKKEAIITAALKAFGEKGFQKVNIKEIAAAAKVSQVSIYNYFGSKEALVKECANKVMEKTFEKSREILTLEISFSDKLFQALSLCSVQMNESLYEFFSEKSREDITLMNLLADNINELKEDIYREYIEAGKSEQIISEHLSADTVLMFMNALNLLGENIKPDELEKKLKEIHHLFLYGLIGDKQK